MGLPCLWSTERRCASGLRPNSGSRWSSGWSASSSSPTSPTSAKAWADGEKTSSSTQTPQGSDSALTRGSRGAGSGPAELPRRVAVDLTGGLCEGEHGVGQSTSSGFWEALEDGGNGSAAMLDELIDERLSIGGQLEHQVAAIQGGFRSSQKAGIDEAVTSPAGVGRVHPHGLGQGPQVQPAAGGNQHEHATLRQRHAVFDLRDSWGGHADQSLSGDHDGMDLSSGD